MSVTSTAAQAQVLLSATEALAAARVYAASIADGVIGRDRAGGVPYAELAALDASGLLGITVPATHGGPDLSPVVLAEVIATIAATDPAIAQIPQAHYLFVDVLAVHGSAEQQERLFADVLAGARLGNGLVVSARDPRDGTIEAIEKPDKRFVVAVQWHPENQSDMAKLFCAFAAAL